MLPFLKPKNIVTTVIARRGKIDLHDVKPEVDAPGQESDPAMEACAEDILRAIDQRSVKDLAKALKNTFEILDSEPHEEGPHTNSMEEGES